jgi:gliding motility associated protien GldN
MYKKIVSLAYCGLLLVALTASTDSFAQKKKKPAAKKPAASSGDYFGTGGGSNNAAPAKGDKKANVDDYFGGGSKSTSSSDYFSSGGTDKKGAATQGASTGGNKPKANIPIVVVPSSGDNPLTDTVKRSLRTENAIDRQLVLERQPLAYEHLREDDAIYRQQVWRVIDTREKMNQSFKYQANEDNGNQLFISVLYRAVMEDKLTAFTDDRFSKPIPQAEFMKIFSGGMDTVDRMDLDGNVVAKEVRSRTFQVDSVVQFQLKEEWIFDKEASRMFIRVLGIAPMMKKYLSTGEAVSEKAYPMFWVYYPDIRPMLARTEVYNPKNFGQRMTWEDLFEGRMFNSFIVKSTLDNINNMPLDAYIKDPLFRLLEGENIKEKIFNYEQGLWSY